MSDDTEWWDDDDPECEEDDRDWCPHCQGEGRTPAPDFLAIEGKSYVACRHCEGGLRWPEYM